MKVPVSWLREHVEIDVTPRRLADDLTLVGLAVDAVESHGDDSVLDIDVTTNRVDCMNVYGVAREASVIYGRPLRPLPLSFGEAGAPAARALSVKIEAPELCPRFCARILDVRVGPSPAWLRDRLELVGVRPINNVVDLTNYVMLEMGHPSHAFDLERIPEASLHVRFAREGERLVTLDGTERTLGPRIGVVAGPREALGLAGIMGGAASEVGDATRQVALEAAYWDPLTIRRAARALGMHTEASHRFERGADPLGPRAATARIAHLLEKIGAGSSRPGLIEQLGAPQPVRSARLRASRMRVVLGAEVPEARSGEILRGLGFVEGAREAGAGQWQVPSWRQDVSREADLIEEVARHHGLQRLPSTLPPAGRAQGLDPALVRERALRQALAGMGLDEIVSYAFVSSQAAADSGQPAVALANPIASDLDVLRASLVIPGLLSALRTNLNHGRRDVRVFEVGRVFAPATPAPRERTHVGLLLAGATRPPHWSERPRAADVFDAKGVLEALGAHLGLPGWRFEREGAPAFLHPGRSARVLLGDQPVGWLGALHPELAQRWELREEAVVAELDVDTLLEREPAAVRYRPLPRFPEVERDLSVVCDRELPAAELEAAVRAAGGPLLRALDLADRYEGAPVPAGKLSLTLHLRFQHPERTLSGEEVQQQVARVVLALRERGAEIRGIEIQLP